MVFQVERIVGYAVLYHMYSYSIRCSEFSLCLLIWSGFLFLLKDKLVISHLRLYTVCKVYLDITVHEVDEVGVKSKLKTCEKKHDILSW